MEHFFTEKETEALLELETRDITMPDGSTRSFSAFRLMWNNFDYLTLSAGYTEKNLLELSVKNAEEMDISVEESFPNVVAYVNLAYRKGLCISEGSFSDVLPFIHRTVRENAEHKKREDRIAYLEERLGRMAGKARNDFNKT